MNEKIKSYLQDSNKRVSVGCGLLMLLNIYNATLGTVLLGIAGALLWLYSDGKLTKRG
jgi:hypothetical protein